MRHMARPSSVEAGERFKTNADTLKALANFPERTEKSGDRGASHLEVHAPLSSLC